QRNDGTGAEIDTAADDDERHAECANGHNNGLREDNFEISPRREGFESVDDFVLRLPRLPCGVEKSINLPILLKSANVLNGEQRGKQNNDENQAEEWPADTDERAQTVHRRITGCSNALRVTA